MSPSTARRLRQQCRSYSGNDAASGGFRGCAGFGAAMIPVPSNVNIWLATGATDMCKGDEQPGPADPAILRPRSARRRSLRFRGTRGDCVPQYWHAEVAKRRRAVNAIATQSMENRSHNAVEVDRHLTPRPAPDLCEPISAGWLWLLIDGASGGSRIANGQAELEAEAPTLADLAMRRRHAVRLRTPARAPST